MMKAMSAALCVCAAGIAAKADIRITEWAYQANGGEFIELTNTGAAPIDMTGWSFDDDSRLPGVLDLSSFGVVAPGESVIITEAGAADFRAAWGLAASVKVVGSNTTNLGRNDEINIYNGVALVDRLTFGDQNILGTIRTQLISGITTPANWGTNNVSAWFFAAAGDQYGSYVSALGDVGSPGVVPAPGVAVVMGLGVLVMGRRRR